MTTSRKQLISSADTPYLSLYFSLCSSRLFCSEDSATSKSFAQRGSWVEDKLLSQSQTFAIDVCD